MVKSSNPNNSREKISTTKRLSNATRKFLKDAAGDWRFSQTVVAIICVLPFVIAFVGASTALMGKPTYKWFTGEDGFAETLQVIFYFSCLLLSLVAAYWYWRSGENLIGVLYLGLSFVFLFMVGEEISWGQRIFGWETAESLASINKQDETNLHNIYGVGSLFKWIQLLVGAYGTIVSIIVWRWKKLQPYRSQLWAVVPHYTLIGYFALLFVWRIYRNFLEPPEGFYFVISEYNEVLELVLAIGFFLFLIFQLRGLSKPK